MADRPSILFLCTGNSARSQMAEALLAARTGDELEVLSAGTDPAAEVNPLAVAVMSERGLDLSGQHPKTLDDIATARSGRPLDLVVTVCGHAAETCPRYAGASRQIHVGFDDPAAATGTEAERLEVFRRVAREIEAALPTMLEALNR
jgi:arsenate reductase